MRQSAIDLPGSVTGDAAHMAVTLGGRAHKRVRARIGAMGTVPIAGEIAPEFELPDSTGAPQRLSELISQGRLVLLFYRGNW